MMMIDQWIASNLLNYYALMQKSWKNGVEF